MDAAAGGILKSQTSAPLGVSAWLEAALVGVLIMPVAARCGGE
jgi:hypothetical protein